MTILRRILGTEQRSVESLAALLEQARGTAAPTSGVVVTPSSALQLTAVYASVRLIADAVAGLPVHAYRPNGTERVAVEPQPRLIVDPYPTISRYDWTFQVMSSLLLTGNAFLVAGARDKRTGAVTVAMPVHPDKVSYRREPDGSVSWKVDKKPVASSDFIHIPGFTIPGEVLGLSPIGQAKQAIGTGIAAERYGGQWFGDAANPSSVLESDVAIDQEAAIEAQARWEASHGGRRRPAVLGALRYRPIAINPDESQFLETQRFSVGQIARLFGVPPHMIGDVEKSTSWGTGIEQQAIGFVTYTLRPWIQRLEAALSRQLPGGQYVRFNVDGLLRADSKTRWANYQLARQIGALNVNEIRAKEEEPSIGPAGDVYSEPLNWGPLGANPTDPTED